MTGPTTAVGPAGFGEILSEAVQTRRFGRSAGWAWVRNVFVSAACRRVGRCCQ
ncbi:MAG TPA: hypothetical protein PK525_00580 [Anaerohalosphaeraceae bacterium]|nr:hypothetical protein [Anaerohalosphaeraceae bacterium]